MRIGYDVVGRSWMYTHPIGRPRALRARHSVENQWDLLAPLGVAPPDPAAHPVTMARRSGGGARRRRASASPPACTAPIDWWSCTSAPATRFGAGRFRPSRRSRPDWRQREPSCRIIVTSGPSERAAADLVIAAARAELPERERDRILSCGEFSLSELRALVERAALYIGGDSGPMHIASTSHVPMVSLYGPTLPARSAPWRAAALAGSSRGNRRTALPAVRTAGLRPRRFPLPDVDSARAGARRSRARTVPGKRVR